MVNYLFIYYSKMLRLKKNRYKNVNIENNVNMDKNH